MGSAPAKASNLPAKHAPRWTAVCRLIESFRRLEQQLRAQEETVADLQQGVEDTLAQSSRASDNAWRKWGVTR